VAPLFIEDATAMLTVNPTDIEAWVYVDLSALAHVEPDARPERRRRAP
jgi:hypothetical protein